MLYHRFVDRGEQKMIVVVELRLGHHKQSVVFSRIASGYGCGRISSRTVRTKQFAAECKLEVDQLLLVERNVGHNAVLAFALYGLQK